jgi:DNA-binding NarL/FixJ family response regulator
LLFERQGRWRAAAGEHHQIVESPVAGIVREARNSVEVTIEAAGAAIPGAIAAGEPSRGYLDVPRLTDGELWASALDVGRAGAIVVAGSRISAQAISRARAMSIRGLIAGSVGQGELRDLEASQLRQKASLAPSVPFGLIALDGHQRRPIATPVLALLAALSGREVAIVTDPPLLIFDVSEVPLPDLSPDWIRVRSGIHAGREGRLLDTAGLYRFHSGVHLEAAVVRFVDETDTTILPFADLERFIF